MYGASLDLPSPTKYTNSNQGQSPQPIIGLSCSQGVRSDFLRHGTRSLAAKKPIAQWGDTVRTEPEIVAVVGESMAQNGEKSRPVLVFISESLLADGGRRRNDFSQLASSSKKRLTSGIEVFSAIAR